MTNNSKKKNDQKLEKIHQDKRYQNRDGKEVQIVQKVGQTKHQVTYSKNNCSWRETVVG